MSNTEKVQPSSVFANQSLDEQQDAIQEHERFRASIEVGRKVGIMAIEQMRANSYSFSTRCG